MTLRGENVTLSFRTLQSPAVLFYVSSFHREFLAVVINKHGEDEEKPTKAEAELLTQARWTSSGKKKKKRLLMFLLKPGIYEVYLELLSWEFDF